MDSEATALDLFHRAISKATLRRIQRQRTRYYKREMNAQRYREAALAGGGKREVARRSGELYRLKHGAA